MYLTIALLIFDLLCTSFILLDEVLVSTFIVFYFAKFAYPLGIVSIFHPRRLTAVSLLYQDNLHMSLSWYQSLFTCLPFLRLLWLGLLLILLCLCCQQCLPHLGSNGFLWNLNRCFYPNTLANLLEVVPHKFFPHNSN